MAENITLVIYDCEDDRVRSQVSEACLDYGLMRIQYSAFRGKLSRSMREELFLKLCELGRDTPYRILVQPICESDESLCRKKENKVDLLGRTPVVAAEPARSGS